MFKSDITKCEVSASDRLDKVICDLLNILSINLLTREFGLPRTHVTPSLYRGTRLSAIVNYIQPCSVQRSPDPDQRPLSNLH